MLRLTGTILFAAVSFVGLSSVLGLHAHERGGVSFFHTHAGHDHRGKSAHAHNHSRGDHSHHHDDNRNGDNRNGDHDHKSHGPENVQNPENTGHDSSHAPEFLFDRLVRVAFQAHRLQTQQADYESSPLLPVSASGFFSEEFSTLRQYTLGVASLLKYVHPETLSLFARGPRAPPLAS